MGMEGNKLGVSDEQIQLYILKNKQQRPTIQHMKLY